MGKYTIDDTTLTAIGDEIRKKTSLTDLLTTEQAVIDIAAIPTVPHGVPNYVRAEAERVASVVKSLQNNNTVSFIAISDAHLGSYNDSPFHAAQAASIIKGLIPIDFTASLGDVVLGASTDTYNTHITNLMDSVRTLSVADPDLRLDGNHDNNIYNITCNLIPSELHRYTSRFNNKSATPPTDRGYFHFDVTDKKLRVICLNTADLKDIVPTANPSYTDGRTTNNQDGHHISAEQFRWLISTLDMSGKVDWKVIVLSHHPLHWYGSMPNVLTILNGYIKGTSGSVSADSQTVSFNFSGKNSAKLVGTFHGHTHNLIHGKVGDNDIVRMGTPNACFTRNNEYGSSGSADFQAKYGEITTYAKTSGTAKDTAFCVYTIDFVDEVIYATCYGAGYDRIMNYGEIPIVTYTVANNLTNVVTDNGTTLVSEGSPYTATLTASTGYEIDTVTVNMGGVDITATAYTSGIIDIASVTGDIVITATGKEIPKEPTNLIDTVGYTNGYRLSSSDGSVKVDTKYDYVVTGYLPITSQSDVFCTKGVNFNNSTYTNCIYAIYNADKQKISAGYITNGTSGNIKISLDADGNILSFNGGSTFPSAGGFLRICGVGKGENLIVTKNEPIE